MEGPNRGFRGGGRGGPRGRGGFEMRGRGGGLGMRGRGGGGLPPRGGGPPRGGPRGFRGGPMRGGGAERGGRFPPGPQGPGPHPVPTIESRGPPQRGGFNNNRGGPGGMRGRGGRGRGDFGPRTDRGGRGGMPMRGRGGRGGGPPTGGPHARRRAPRRTQRHPVRKPRPSSEAEDHHMAALEDHRNAEGSKGHAADGQRATSHQLPMLRQPTGTSHLRTPGTSPTNSRRQIRTRHSRTAQAHIKETTLRHRRRLVPHTTQAMAPITGTPVAARAMKMRPMVARATRATARARRRTAPRPPTTRTRSPPTAPTKRRSPSTTTTAVGDLFES
nr:myosin heavy chain IB-like [Maniola hyperantus]